eukprot:TRINITY_DN8483_c0_g1_i1.p1 TRINITY_DN8483_c0_g1~~TRINITY_DN8483_c0_g1_i1.p1  ORF type:complete len:422 (+),score=83.13 TRINITY_DN8483_c0_g1_i1:228-1493(+)
MVMKKMDLEPKHDSIHRCIAEWWERPENGRYTVLMWKNTRPNVSSWIPSKSMAFVSSHQNRKELISSIFIESDVLTPFKRLLMRTYLGEHLSVLPGHLFHLCSGRFSEKTELKMKRTFSRRTYFGKNNCIEYVLGNIPVVISAPHGGHIKPSEMKNRTTGVLDGDKNTIPLLSDIVVAMTNQSDLQNEIPRLPHVIICHLSRLKLDANRNRNDASLGDVHAQAAWDEFHNFIEIAKMRSIDQYGFCQYFDLHGNDSSKKVMIGQMTRKADFESQVEGHLESKMNEFCSSASLLRSKPDYESKESLMMGATSFAKYFQDESVKRYGSNILECTPIGKTRGEFDWGGPDFYNGGYNTGRHGSLKNSGKCNGIQIETPTHLRLDSTTMQTFGEAFAAAILLFVKEHYHCDLNVCVPPKIEKPPY